MSKKTLIVLTIGMIVISIMLALTNIIFFGIEIAIIMALIIIGSLENLISKIKGNTMNMLIVRQVIGITLPGVVFGFIARCILNHQWENLIRVFIVFVMLLLIIKKINSRRS